ncbi:MAG: hypothetical protein IPN19_05915 [Elusimicrobia bacterium]|nr:hypothetical protein [Elusimicrobiota bacterium]
MTKENELSVEFDAEIKIVRRKFIALGGREYFLDNIEEGMGFWNEPIMGRLISEKDIAKALKARDVLSNFVGKVNRLDIHPDIFIGVQNSLMSLKIILENKREQERFFFIRDKYLGKTKLGGKPIILTPFYFGVPALALHFLFLTGKPNWGWILRWAEAYRGKNFNGRGGWELLQWWNGRRPKNGFEFEACPHPIKECFYDAVKISLIEAHLHNWLNHASWNSIYFQAKRLKIWPQTKREIVKVKKAWVTTKNRLENSSLCKKGGHKNPFVLADKFFPGIGGFRHQSEIVMRKAFSRLDEILNRKGESM